MNGWLWLFVLVEWVIILWNGMVVEWMNAVVLKVIVLRGIEGSNFFCFVVGFLIWV